MQSQNLGIITSPEAGRGYPRSYDASIPEERAQLLAQYLADFERTIGRERLDAYRVPAGDDLEMLANYVWNMTLSEALYPALDGIEIALRNSIHAAAVARFGTDRWFDTQAVLPLKANELKALTDAKRSLSRRGRPLTPGRVIAELHFGFWINLFNAPYEQFLWSPQPGRTNLLRATFPYVPRAFRARQRLRDHLDKIRRLRNRVFHHEPIWNWNLPNLSDQHGQIIDAIGSISPRTRQVIDIFDRFPNVYRQGRLSYRVRLAQIVR